MNNVFYQIGSREDIAHNVTWTGKVFSSVHGILLGSIFFVYQFGEEEDIVKEAKEIKEKSNLIHPCIFEALDVLSLAKYSDNVTFERLLKCCFLVPSFHRK